MRNKSMMLYLLILSGAFSFIFGQAIIYQDVYHLSLSDADLNEELEFASQRDEAAYFMQLSDEALFQLVQSGGEQDRESTVIYFDNDQIAFESNGVDGHSTVISGKEKGQFYYILHDEKTVYTVRQEDINAVKEKAENATREMMKNLPPEYQQQIEENMKSAKTAPQYHPVATGKKQKINGFECREYRIENDEEMILIWASGDDKKIVNKLKKMTEKWTSLFEDDAEGDFDEWSLIADKIPVYVRHISLGMVNAQLMEIREIVKIDWRRPPAEKFKIPGNKEGYKQASFMDLMQSSGDMK